MAQCIRLGCRREAWSDPSTGERSYFCIDDAWKNATGMLALTEAQRAIYNNEGFNEALKHIACFPLWFREKHEIAIHPGRKTQYHKCLDCPRSIVSSAGNYCGKHRTKRGLPEPDISVLKIRCFNYGKHLDRECRVSIPVTEAWTLPDGNQYCGPCRLLVQQLNSEARRDWGYNF